LGEDGAGVHVFVDGDDGVAGGCIAGDDGGVDWRCAAPSWEQAGVKIDGKAVGDEFLAEVLAIGNDDPGAGIE